MKKLNSNNRFFEQDKNTASHSNTRNEAGPTHSQGQKSQGNQQLQPSQKLHILNQHLPPN